MCKERILGIIQLMVFRTKHKINLEQLLFATLNTFTCLSTKELEFLGNPRIDAIHKVLTLVLLSFSLIQQSHRQHLEARLSLNVGESIFLSLQWKLTTLLNLNDKNPLKFRNLRMIINGSVETFLSWAWLGPEFEFPGFVHC